jgi:hypothetical protein
VSALEDPLQEDVLIGTALGERDRVAAGRAREGFEQGGQLRGRTKVGVVVGALLPPSGSTLTATVPVRSASTGSGTTVTPCPFGLKVPLGIIVLVPFAAVQASYTCPRGSGGSFVSAR